MIISIIAAMDEKMGIGKNGKIPWHIPEDLKRFKQITTNHVVIMGRKTYQSIGTSLPNRVNIVVSKNQDFNPVGAMVVGSIPEAIDLAKKFEKDEIFIIGGSEMYFQTINLADKLYLTLVKGDYKADAFFPDYSEFSKLITKVDKESGEYKYTFIDLKK